MSARHLSNTFLEPISNIIDDGCYDHRSNNPEFDNLADVVAEAIRFEDGAGIAEVMGAVDELRQRCSTMQRPSVADHLDGIFRVLAASAKRRLPLPDGLTGSDRMILFRLGTGTMSGRQLAEQAGLTVETVARRLPRLRAASLVQSWKEGRETRNQCTPAGAAALAGWRPEGAATPDTGTPNVPTRTLDVGKLSKQPLKKAA